jgi:predicted amidohydrolase YtcJ
MEEKLGSIEVGKLADLAVLSDDYFTVPDDQIRRIRSVMTVVDGKIVHDAGVLQ